MNLRKRSKPLVLKKLEAVIPRMSPQFPHLIKLQQEISNRIKGYKGEMDADYHLEKFASNYITLHDVCLIGDGRTFQVDSIVITAHAIFCIDVKNYKGKIIFNTNLNQFSRSNGQIESGFEHPIAQAESHQFQLCNWLQERNLDNIPVYFFIAISDPSTMIEVIGDEAAIGEMVAHAAFLPQKILEKDEALQSSGQPKLASLEIGKTILRACKEHDFDILTRCGINFDDILTGVQCPTCQRLKMERKYGTWECKHCHTRAKHAHKQAIADYLLLVKPWITNEQCMRFLNIKSRSLATRLLKSCNLTYQKKYNRWIR
jgi:hypothetical protein